MGGGVRVLYADGEVKLSYPNVYRSNLSGNSEPKFGYYLSATFKPMENLTLSALYRSKVDLDIEGDADGYLAIPGEVFISSLPPETSLYLYLRSSGFQPHPNSKKPSLSLPL